MSLLSNSFPKIPEPAFLENSLHVLSSYTIKRILKGTCQDKRHSIFGRRRGGEHTSARIKMTFFLKGSFSSSSSFGTEHDRANVPHYNGSNPLSSPGWSKSPFVFTPIQVCKYEHAWHEVKHPPQDTSIVHKEGKAGKHENTKTSLPGLSPHFWWFVDVSFCARQQHEATSEENTSILAQSPGESHQDVYAW